MLVSIVSGLLGAGVLLKVGNKSRLESALIALILTTGVAHILVGIADLILLLNGLGYFFFAAATLLVPNAYKLHLRLMLVGYTVLTIVLYFASHPWGYSHGAFDYLGVITKLVEFLILLIVYLSAKETKWSKNL